MIAKLVPRKHGSGSFEDSINYQLGISENDHEKVEYVNTLNIFYPEDAAIEMQALAVMNARSADPVFSCVLSWRENEIPTRKQVDESVEIVLNELGLMGCQTHYALHGNTQNLHLHICVNRIDPETYKARNPANGWTINALERAARQIEYAQGWPIEQSGRYTETCEGEIVEKPKQSEHKIRLSQGAQDLEAHTATKSAERIGQETAAPIIRSSGTWAELHQNLAERGFRYERQGSGAIIFIGETSIKASQAGRDISHSKLEKRLGEYQERHVSIQINSREPEPVDRVESEPKVRQSWKDYHKEKSNYYATKKSAYAVLKKRQKAERDFLFCNQDSERTSSFGVQYTVAYISTMAAKHKREELHLAEHHKEERTQLKKRFPQRFPNFKNWLNLETDPELLALYRYPDQLVLFCADAKENNASEAKFDLRDYCPVVDEKFDRVMYCKHGKSIADFIDYGRRIVLSKECDEASVLATLQLATQKWGTINISGSTEYKNLCIKLAVQHGFKIVNPEMQADIEACRIRDTKRIDLKIGAKVTFTPHGLSVNFTGKVLVVDNDRGIVTLGTRDKDGNLREVLVNCNNGHFSEVAELQQVKEAKKPHTTRSQGSSWSR